MSDSIRHASKHVILSLPHTNEHMCTFLSFATQLRSHTLKPGGTHTTQNRLAPKPKRNTRSVTVRIQFQCVVNESMTMPAANTFGYKMLKERISYDLHRQRHNERCALT